MLTPTSAEFLQRWHEVVITDDGQCCEDVQRNEDVDGHTAILALFRREEIRRELFNGAGRAVQLPIRL